MGVALHDRSKVTLWAMACAIAVAGCGPATPATPGAASSDTPAAASEQATTPTLPEPQPSAQPADPSAVASARQLIEAADFADPASIDAVGASVRFTRAGENASRAVLESPESDTAALWTATWVYGSSGTDPAPLRPLLAQPDPTIRAMAAACLVALGDASGFDALVEALASDASTAGSEPPITIRQYAINTLSRYVTGEGVPQPAEEIDDEDDGSVAAAEWEAWLSANVENLVFDPPSATWAVP